MAERIVIQEGNKGASIGGDKFWTVEFKIGVCSGEMTLYADRVEIKDGALLFIQDQSGLPYMAFAPGLWERFYATSVFDGHAVSVDNWWEIAR
jgi:hypothetical protein